jgi:hypothetical protein
MAEEAGDPRTASERPSGRSGARTGAYTGRVVWEGIFMLLVLKIPLVYLCFVVWWAIRAEPRPEEPAALVPAITDTPPGADPRTPHRPRRRPSGPPRDGSGPARRPVRTRVAPVRAEARR